MAMATTATWPAAAWSTWDSSTSQKLQRHMNGTSRSPRIHLKEVRTRDRRGGRNRESHLAVERAPGAVVLAVDGGVAGHILAQDQAVEGDDHEEHCTRKPGVRNDTSALFISTLLVYGLRHKC